MSDLRITMIRCSTLLLEWPGLRLLTDPWFGWHLHGLPCLRRPGLRVEGVGATDVVLVSHLHPDHFDRGALDRLTPPPRLVVLPPGALGCLRPAPPPSYRELAPWDALTVGPATVTAVPGPHTWPPPEEINFVVQVPGWGRVFFGGDARFDESVMQAIAGRFAPIRLALLPVGGTRILGRRTVMAPDDALRAATLLQAETVIPIHEGGVWVSVPPLSLHPGRARHLQRLVARAGSGPRVVVLREGESVSIALP